MTMIDVGPLSDIPREGARLIRTHLGCVAVFRTADDQVFALEDRCPHKGGPLSEGIVHGTSVTCPLHNQVFNLNTGAGTEDTVRTFAIRTEQGRVLIDAALLASSAA